MYLPTDRIQQILSCARCAALGSQLYPLAKIPAVKDCKLLAFYPFSQTGLHGRQGLGWDSCMCLPVTDSLSWGKDTHFLLLSRFLNAGLFLPRHWVEETSGQRDWGQGWVGGWNNIYHLSRSLISKQIVFELLGAVWVITENQQFPELKDPQHNSVQKPHSAIIWKIVLSK